MDIPLIKNIATKYGIAPELVLAVAEVESNGRNGYAPDGSGRLLVLFEAHIFYNQLQQRGFKPAELMKKYPNLISPVWNQKLYKGGAFENQRLMEAIAIHREAAFYSASYGMFQIMGFNHVNCGFKTVDEFISYNRVSQENQVECFIRYIKSIPAMFKALINRDAARFARLYNGPEFKKNDYDTKILKAIEKYKNV